MKVGIGNNYLVKSLVSVLAVSSCYRYFSSEGTGSEKSKTQDLNPKELGFTKKHWFRRNRYFIL